MLTATARRLALALATDAARQDARGAQARRRLVNDVICVRAHGAWTYALPGGDTTDDAPAACAAWARASR